MKSSQKAPMRVFVSSTYEDMIPYRDAASEALTSIEQLPIGMEYFVASQDRPLDVCLSDVRRSDLYILLLGMRYGSIDKDTGKSFTQLEYEEAIRSGISVLAFVINENECAVLPKFVDKGDSADKLAAFKAELDNQHLTSRFSSDTDLKEKIVRAVQNYIEKKDANKEVAKEQTISIDYHEGALIFKKFILLPERYKNHEVTLRVQMTGGFSTWRAREEHFNAFGLTYGDTLRLNDLSVLGVDLSDVDVKLQVIDCYAEGKMADWVLNNHITNGTIFEGQFRLMYETVENGASRGIKEVDAKIASIILIKGVTIIEQSKKGKALKIN